MQQPDPLLLELSVFYDKIKDGRVDISGRLYLFYLDGAAELLDKAQKAGQDIDFRLNTLIELNRMYGNFN